MAVLRTIKRFLREREMAPTRFGRLAVGDPRLIRDLERGREPRAATVARIEAFIADQQGDGR